MHGRGPDAHAHIRRIPLCKPSRNFRYSTCPVMYLFAPLQTHMTSRGEVTGVAGTRLEVLLLLFASVNLALSLETQLVLVLAGRDALLPCAAAPRHANLSVFWRGLDDAHLFDILDGRPDPGTQTGRFRGRVESFPERYAQGNFSLRLRGAEPGDAGRYTCHVPSLDLRQEVELRVEGRAAEVPQDSGDSAPPKDASSRGRSADTLPFDPALPLLLGASVLLLGMN